MHQFIVKKKWTLEDI